LDTENPHFEGTFEIPDLKVRIATAVSRTKSDGQNVIGVIPAHSDEKDVEYIVIGAHYDHIGYGEVGSLARKDEEGQIHNGADDKRVPEDFRRGVVVALWSGEELGLIGSSYFVEHPPRPLENIVAYVNFDMVGRLRDNKPILQGVGSSTRWPALIEQHNVAAGFNLVLQTDPFLPTDVSAFYPKSVPVISFFTGSHEDYNRPTDDWQTLDYDGMERIGYFAYALTTDLVASTEPLDYAKVERRPEKSGQRGALRAYLGTIPDYAAEGIEGVKLSGVRAGGPADKAGLRGGDIIVTFGGKKIYDIYDYTYALDAVKVGSEVEVVVLRDEKLVTLTVIPEARK
jgi:Zn-dependent M28 family amino/carboxypeptidase